MKKLMKIIRHPGWYLWFLPGLLAFAAQRLLEPHPAVVEALHSRGIFQFLAIPLSWLTSQVPFSLTEMLLVLGVPLLLAGLTVWIVRLIRQKNRLARFGRLLRRLAWTISLLYLAFMLLHGLNFARQPAAVLFNLPVRERSAEELEAATDWLVSQANQLRAKSEEDEQGVFRLSQSIGETMRTLHLAFDAAGQKYPVLNGPAVRPKGVVLSRPWSYTGISGMYFPFLAEANVNIDMPHYQIPFTALHEIAHTRGFAREDEANFLAFLTGIADSRPDIAYSVVIDAAGRSLSALHGADRKAWERVASRLDLAIRRDFAAASAYWKQFEGPVREASTQINNAYLQANLQQDGVKSYGRMLDLVLAWHESRSRDGLLGSSVAALQGGD